MPLSRVQIGAMAVYEFAKLAMIGSNGRIEVSFPLSDDERRDAEAHIRGQFGESIALQVKCATRIYTYPQQKSPRLLIAFRVRKADLVTDPRFHYFMVFFPVPKEIQFEDPQFFVSSVKMHQHAVPRLVNGIVRYTFAGSMTPNSRDIWVPDRTFGTGVGRVLLDTLEDHEKLPRAQRPIEPFRLPPGAIVIRRTR